MPYNITSWPIFMSFNVLFFIPYINYLTFLLWMDVGWYQMPFLHLPRYHIDIVLFSVVCCITLSCTGWIILASLGRISLNHGEYFLILCCIVCYYFVKHFCTYAHYGYCPAAFFYVSSFSHCSIRANLCCIMWLDNSMMFTFWSDLGRLIMINYWS